MARPAGIWDKSRRQTRNGALGGAIGGLLGGLLFDPLTGAGSGMAARATAFVILGVSIGALVGLAQLVLKEAWLTVVDGYRPGREWIIGQDVTTLGRGDHLPLPFLGYPGRDLESEHARIVRQPDGAFLLEDNHSRLGTRLNGQSIQSPTPLADGDLIKIGSNIVRFNLRKRGMVRAAVSAAAISSGGFPLPPPPPPPPTPRPWLGQTAKPQAERPPLPSMPPPPPPPPPASRPSFPSHPLPPPPPPTRLE